MVSLPSLRASQLLCSRGSFSLALGSRCREQQLPKSNEIIEKLDPIIQATKLLQTKKTEEHISTIVEMCYKLR